MLGCFLVHVDPGELQCNVRALPYGCCIGVLFPCRSKPKGRVEIWTPAASIPRGYRAAAKAMLETALECVRCQCHDGRFCDVAHEPTICPCGQCPKPTPEQETFAIVALSGLT